MCMDWQSTQSFDIKESRYPGRDRDVDEPGKSLSHKTTTR